MSTRSTLSERERGLCSIHRERERGLCSIYRERERELCSIHREREREREDFRGKQGDRKIYKLKHCSSRSIKKLNIEDDQ